MLFGNFSELMLTSGGQTYYERISEEPFIKEVSVYVNNQQQNRQRRPKKKYRTFHRNANVHRSQLEMAIDSCKNHQRGLGFNVIFSDWDRSKYNTYKVVTRNYATYVEEIFWFHVY